MLNTSELLTGDDSTQKAKTGKMLAEAKSDKVVTMAFSKSLWLQSNQREYVPRKLLMNVKYGSKTRPLIGFL